MLWQVRTIGILYHQPDQVTVREVTSRVDILQIHSTLRNDHQTVLSRLLRGWNHEPISVSVHSHLEPTKKPPD